MTQVSRQHNAATGYASQLQVKFSIILFYLFSNFYRDLFNHYIAVAHKLATHAWNVEHVNMWYGEILKFVTQAFWLDDK